MPNKTAVLVELDYKAEYIRYALTPETFADEFPDSPAPTTAGDTDTLRPLVHVWYMLTSVGSSAWNTFFTDMYDGLPEGDIINENPAWVSYDRTDPSLLVDVYDTTFPRINDDVAAEYKAIANSLPAEHHTAAHAIWHMVDMLTRY